MKILIPVDGSDATGRTLDFIEQRREWFDPSHAYTFLHVLMVYPSRALDFIGSRTAEHYYAEDAEKVFAPIRARVAARGLQATYVHVVGHASQAITARATDGGHDVVVLGSHGHGSLLNIVLGSVVTQVLAHCTVPVLVVR